MLAADEVVFPPSILKALLRHVCLATLTLTVALPAQPRGERAGVDEAGGGGRGGRGDACMVVQSSSGGAVAVAVTSASALSPEAVRQTARQKIRERKEIILARAPLSFDGAGQEGACVIFCGVEWGRARAELSRMKN